MMKKIFIPTFIVTVAMVACSTAKNTIESPSIEPIVVVEDDNDLIYAKAKWSDVTKAQLEHGQEIAETKCTQCHKQKPIENFTEEHWAKAINDMAPKAHLSSKEKKALERYIFTQKGIEG